MPLTNHIPFNREEKVKEKIEQEGMDKREAEKRVYAKQKIKRTKKVQIKGETTNRYLVNMVFRNKEDADRLIAMIGRDKITGMLDGDEILRRLQNGD